MIIELAEDGYDPDVLATAAAVHSAAAVRRVGWILERLAGRDASDIHDLAAARDAAPSLLDPSGPTTGGSDPRWGLRTNRDPDEIEDESW